MGMLKPGVTYVYERDGGIIYAREFGETKRQVVGYSPGEVISAADERMMSELNEVVKMCETDPGMKSLLDQLFVMYNLKKHE